MGVVHAKSSEPEVAKLNFEELEARVQRVHIEGLARTKDDVVMNSVRDMFVARDFRTLIFRIHESRLKLESLGCFKNVNVYLDTYSGPGAVKDGIEVTFIVEELNLFNASVQTNAGNNEGTATMGGEVKNVFGRGEVLSSEYSYSTNKTTSFNTRFDKPFHNDASTLLKTSIYQQSSQSPWSGFKELDRGVLLSLGFFSAPNVQQKLILDGVWRHLSCLSRTTPFAVREQSGHSLKSAFRHELNVDTRDENIFPTGGAALSIKNELAGLGGDIGFFKNELDMQLNFSLPKQLIVQGCIQAGYMMPLRNNKTHLITDRYILGGATSIRGFEMAGVGPHSEGCALGAETYWAAGLHLYSFLPLLRQGTISEKFRLHAFINTGNLGDFVFKEDQKQNLNVLLKDVRLSYGAGVVMNLGGVARVELNYCIPVLLQRGDRPLHGIQFGVATHFL